MAMKSFEDIEMANRRDGIETRRRILAAACDVFAERGYRGATNAEICRRSKSNGAAVNYHFRSKEALYTEAFKQALEESVRAHRPEPGGSASMSPELKLKAMILSVLKRISDPANKSFAMLHKEMTEPTRLLDGVMGDFINSEMIDMKNVVGEMLGKGAPPRMVDLCAMSVLAQCIHPAIRERGRMDGRHPGGAGIPFDASEIASHVFEFSKAAIQTFAARSGRAS